MHPTGTLSCYFNALRSHGYFCLLCSGRTDLFCFDSVKCVQEANRLTPPPYMAQCFQLRREKRSWCLRNVVSRNVGNVFLTEMSIRLQKGVPHLSISPGDTATFKEIVFSVKFTIQILSA